MRQQTKNQLDIHILGKRFRSSGLKLFEYHGKASMHNNKMIPHISKM